MQTSHYTAEELRKYGRLFAKLPKMDLPFEVKSNIIRLYENNQNLNNLGIDALRGFCFEVGKRILSENLSTPELICFTKYCLKVWAGILSFARPENTKFTPIPKHVGHFRKPKLRAKYPARIGRDYVYPKM